MYVALAGGLFSASLLLVMLELIYSKNVVDTLFSSRQNRTTQRVTLMDYNAKKNLITVIIALKKYYVRVPSNQSIDSFCVLFTRQKHVGWLIDWMDPQRNAATPHKHNNLDQDTKISTLCRAASSNERTLRA